MKKLLQMKLCLILLVSFTAYGQERTISGRVVDRDASLPLPGVNVVVKGTAQGTFTDADGNYRLNVPVSSQTLVFSFVGYQSSEVDITGQTTVDVSLVSDVTQLSEVVVTGLGIEREKRALGYAVTTLQSDMIAQKSEGDIGRLLRGKAPGINITQTSGVSGTGTNIIIRGFTSISGSNQPLWVVDGVPFDGGTNQQDDFQDGQTESSRFLDLDPNNIESMSILKGLSATVLYGDRGRNGVILVTTKSGSTQKIATKNEVTFSQSFFNNEIASLPDYSEKYGTGIQQQFGNFFSNWGPGFEELGQVPHPFTTLTDPTLQASFPELVGTTYEYQAYPSVKNFFRKGVVSTTSVGFRGSANNMGYNVSYSHLDDKGFTPGNRLKRDNFSVGGNARLTNKINVGATANIVNTNYRTPPIASSFGSGVTGGGSSVFADLFYTPISVDLMNWPYQTLDGRSIYYRGGNDIQNPRWTVANAYSQQLVDRIFGNAYVDYSFMNWLNLKYRIGLDTYNEANTYAQNKGGVDGNINGIYRTVNKKNTIMNHDLILSGRRDLSDNFKLSSTIGFNARRDTRYEQGVESANQIVFGVFKHYNFTDHNSTGATTGDLEFQSAENRLGLYGQFEIAFNDYLFVTLSGRNDWANTTEKENNSLFYPSVAVAYDITSSLPALQDSKVLTYLKARAAYATSANFPGPYTTRNTLDLTSRSLVTRAGTVVRSNSVANRLGNPLLRPELQTEIELGLESRLFDKINAEVTVFKRNTTDLIVDQNLDPSTGYSVTNTNAGELEVRGVEVALNANLLTLGKFTWNANANGAVIRNEVVDLPDGISQLTIAGFSDIGNFAIEGKPYGVIMGYPRMRDDNGRFLIDASGYYIVDNETAVIGNPNPDWTANLTNTFNFKGIRLSVELQYVHGGDIYSRTAANLVGRGVTKETDSFDRRNSFIIDGVTQEGEPNKMQITSSDLYFENIGFGADDLKIWDGTTIRLNEVSLGYTLPKAMLSKTPFGTVSINASGYNLWYKAVNFPDAVNFDPNAIGTGVGNGQGLDFLSGPSSKRYGVSLNLTF